MKPILSLDDIAKERMNVRATCKCGHVAVFNGNGIWRWFAIHRYNGVLTRAQHKFRCAACRGRGAKLEATTEAPTIDWLPKSEDDWKRRIRQLRG